MASESSKVVIISPSLLENIKILHPIPPQSSIGMEEWTEPYLASSVSDTSVTSNSQQTDSNSSSAPVDWNPKPRPGLEKQQPCPHVPSNNQVHPLECEPPLAKESHFSTLSKQELDSLSKAFVPKNTENSTKWALDNFNSWVIDKKGVVKRRFLTPC